MAPDSNSRNPRLYFVSLLAWVAVCVLVAGWGFYLDPPLADAWMCAGLFGLVSAVGLGATELLKPKRLPGGPNAD